LVSDIKGLKAFENRVLRIFGPKTDEAIGDRRKLHNEEFRNPYSWPNIIRITKSRRMRWARHIARMRAKKNAYRILGKGRKKGTTGKTKKWVG
jgi:hypothetical protein